jgi:hypothetical protein
VGCALNHAREFFLLSTDHFLVVVFKKLSQQQQQQEFQLMLYQDHIVLTLSMISFFERRA